MHMENLTPITNPFFKLRRKKIFLRNNLELWSPDIEKPTSRSAMGWIGPGQYWPKTTGDLVRIGQTQNMECTNLEIMHGSVLRI